ncbi:MAG: 2-oxo-4-hydroxy-4-carboxy-5-ureidoimidazoline decarboxylase [Halieaceae bacterium]
MSLSAFNALDERRAAEALALCCVSERWVSAMLGARPFKEAQSLFAAADRLWAELAEDDYLQAFEGHPKIGDISSLKEKYAASGGLAASEQSSLAEADDAVIGRLCEGNRVYEERFGFIFIVCASNKNALEMCELLEQRLHNDRHKELQVAAEEQRKILQLRLEKML